MNRLIDITTPDDIFAEYEGTPIGLLLEYHNFNKPLDKFTEAQLLIGMCMDNRKHLRIPDNFAFIIRAGGANLRFSEFKVSVITNAEWSILYPAKKNLLMDWLTKQAGIKSGQKNILCILHLCLKSEMRSISY